VRFLVKIVETSTNVSQKSATPLFRKDNGNRRFFHNNNNNLRHYTTSRLGMSKF